MPDVVGLPIEEAERKLAHANFTPIREEVESFEPAGTVLTQSPGGGARVRLGSGVTLGVSNGKGEPIVVPRLTGLSEDAAVHELDKLGLAAAIERVPVDDKHLDGVVVDQIPIGDGTKIVDIGSTVTIWVGTFEQGNGNGGGNGNGNGSGGVDGGGGDAAAVTPGALPRRFL